MPFVPPGRGRSGFRRLDEYQVVPGIQGLPSAARALTRKKSHSFGCQLLLDTEPTIRRGASVPLPCQNRRYC